MHIGNSNAQRDGRLDFFAKDLPTDDVKFFREHQTFLDGKPLFEHRHDHDTIRPLPRGFLAPMRGLIS